MKGKTHMNSGKVIHIKFFVCASFVFFIALFLPKLIAADTGYINDDIHCERIEIRGLNSLYVTGELAYYVEDDSRFEATILFYDIFDTVLAKAYIKVVLKKNDTSVSFDEPIYIDHESDFLEVKGTHHIGWRIDTIQTIECCVDHGGIMGCDEDTGKITCYDGEIVLSCKCDEYNLSK